MNFLRIVLYVLLASLIISAALFLYYYLPRTDVVQISGTDIKRMDKGSKAEIATRDVRFISAKTRTNDTRVYRNEDTGWGWPPYFKFNSADLAGQGQTLAGATEKSWVLVTYYGWRVSMVSAFPNAISLEKVNKDYSHLPLFNIFVLGALAAAILYIAFSLWRKRSSLHTRSE